jgi:hypothetical protein
MSRHDYIYFYENVIIKTYVRNPVYSLTDDQ